MEENVKYRSRQLGDFGESSRTQSGTLDGNLELDPEVKFRGHLKIDLEFLSESPDF